MRVSALPGMPAITYITALGMILCGKDGNKHTVEIMVKDSHNLETSCPSDYVCLADGALTVLLDSKEIMGPGMFDTGNGVVVTAANIPGECHPFGFEKYWMAQQDKDENNAIHGRRLEEVFPMSEWLMRDTLRTNPRECDLYVKRAAESDSLFDHQSEHTSFQIAFPHLSLRVNHGKINQIAMRDPTDTLDLPDHVAYQMNLAFRKIQLGDDPRGILGETVHPVLNESGAPIMEGPKTLRADEESYRVHCLLCSEFAQLLEL
ncbi:unnamed protein product [Choristocarpus tenellus]